MLELFKDPVWTVYQMSDHLREALECVPRRQDGQYMV